MISSRINSILDSLDMKIEEFASCIMDYPETQVQDIMYEEIVYYLNELKNKLEVLLEITTSNER
jgi:hypothetical protein